VTVVYADAETPVVRAEMSARHPSRWPGPSGCGHRPLVEDMGFFATRAISRRPASGGMWTTAADWLRFGCS